MNVAEKHPAGIGKHDHNREVGQARWPMRKSTTVTLRFLSTQISAVVVALLLARAYNVVPDFQLTGFDFD